MQVAVKPRTGDPGRCAAREGIRRAGGMAGSSWLGKDLELGAIVITPHREMKSEALPLIGSWRASGSIRAAEPLFYRGKLPLINRIMAPPVCHWCGATPAYD